MRVGGVSWIRSMGYRITILRVVSCMARANTGPNSRATVSRNGARRGIVMIWRCMVWMSEGRAVRRVGRIHDMKM